MGKVEIGIYFCVTADILTKVLQKCSWSSPLQTIWIWSKLLILIGGYGNRNVKFSKKKLKNLPLRSHKGDEAETLHKCLCYYPLHKLCFFYCCCACGFVAVATLSFHRFIMGKVKVGLYFCLTLVILTKALQFCSLSSPLTTIWIKPKLLNLISCHGKRKVNFSCMQHLQYFWLNTALIAVHSGERWDPWAYDFSMMCRSMFCHTCRSRFASYWE